MNSIYSGKILLILNLIKWPLMHPIEAIWKSGSELFFVMMLVSECFIFLIFYTLFLHSKMNDKTNERKLV